MVSEEKMADKTSQPVDHEQAGVSASGIAATSEESGVTLTDLVQVILAHAITAFVTGAVVFLAVCAYTLLVTPRYTATAQVFVSYNPGSSVSDDISNINTAGSYISNQIKSYPALAKTESVLQPVIDDLGLNETSADLADSIEVTNPTDTALVNIAVTNTDPKQSAQIANAVADSLSSVVSSKLYENGQQSPIKLSVVQQAVEPASPSYPKVSLNLLIGAVIAVMLGMLAAVLKDHTETRIQDLDDLQNILAAPVIGRVPFDNVLSSDKPVVIGKPGTAIAEEFRRIRTNLSFTAPVVGGKSRLLVISSASPEDGKTTMAVNIAAALAENDASVLLIDADLRHPSVAEKLGMEGGAGLVHVLSGQSAVKDVIQEYWKPTLHIMPAGPKPPNASVLLNSSTMRVMVQEALKSYDYVLVDTSPMSIANDAVVFGEIGRGVMLVVRRGRTIKHDLKDVTGELNGLGVPVTGVVFNSVKASERRGHQGYYYYYDDGDKKNDKNPDSKPGHAAK